MDRQREAELLQQIKDLKAELAYCQSQDALWNWDICNNCTVRNALHDTMLGYLPGELGDSQKLWEDSIHPEDKVQVSKLVEDILEKRSTNFDIEYRLKKKTGDYIWVLGRGRVIEFADDGSPSRMIGTNIDITERKLAEFALSESEQKLHQITTTTPNYLLEIDIQGRIIYVNRTLHGLTPADIVGTLMVDICPKDHRAAVSDLIERLFLTNESQHIEWSFTDPNGIMTSYFCIMGIPCEAGHGKTSILSLVDVTALKRLEENLRFKNLAFDASIAANSTADMNGLLTEVNKGFLAAWGYSNKAEVIGKPISDFLHKKKEVSAIIAALNSEGVWEGEYSAKKRDGSTFVALGLATLLHDKNNTVIGYQSSVVDITDRKKMESTIRRDHERTRLYLELAGVMFIALDSSGIITLANRRACQVLEAGENDLLGQNWFDLCIPERIREEVRHVYNQLMLGKINAVEFYENEVLTSSGDERIIAWHNTYLKDEAGKISGTIASGEDITERKRSEEKLQLAYDEIRSLKERIEAENVVLRQEIQTTQQGSRIIGESRVIREMLAQATTVADTEATVLIQGETGTGKEILARAIHSASKRQGKQLVIVNCAAIPPALFESELFGHEKGAFTHAATRRIGRFEIADGSSIFLDEIGEVPMGSQAKLLRILEQGEFERLGSSKSIRCDVRVIAATNRNLQQLVDQGHFRSDLYYRLDVYPMVVPPLRERSEDIEQLVWAFVKQIGARMGLRVASVSRESLEELGQHTWPGNVRELRNLVERSMIGYSGGELRIELPRSASIVKSKPRSLTEMERNHIQDVLRSTQWRVRGKGGAAEMLSINPSTLESRMKKLGITRPQ